MLLIHLIECNTLTGFNGCEFPVSVKKHKSDLVSTDDRMIRLSIGFL